MCIGSTPTPWQAGRYDIQSRVAAGSARYIETLDGATTEEIVGRLLSVLDPDQ